MECGWKPRKVGFDPERDLWCFYEEDGPPGSGMGPTDTATTDGGNISGSDDAGVQDSMMDELDDISDIFDALDKAYDDAEHGNWINTTTDYTVLNAKMEVMNFDPRGERGGAEKAGFLAGALGFDDLEAQLLSEVNTGRSFTDIMSRAGIAIADAVGSRFGTPVGRDYVFSPVGQGFIGKVTDDFSLSDLVGNLIGTVVPGGAQVDRSISMDITGRGMGARDFATSRSLFGQTASLMTPAEREAAIAAQLAEDEARAAGGGDPVYGASVIGASGGVFRSGLRPSLTNVVGPSIYPDLYDGASAVGDFFTDVFSFAEGGTVKKANGGSVDSQMSGVMSSESFPTLNAAEVRKDPESFMRNPMKARTADELQAMYRYNEYVLEVAKTPLKAQEGMQVGEPGADPSGDGPVGFVGKRTPESLPEAKTVADDVPVDVEEGTFIINAAAVEFAGSDDIKAMLLDAISEARRQGVDISGDENKIDREKAVSLLVSEGEVVVPPLLAKIIGYDRLNKINNRGKQEVEKRVEENGQSPEAEALDDQPSNPAEGMAMAPGGVAEKLRDDLSYSYGDDPEATSRIIQGAQKRNPKEFASIQEANTQRKIDALNRIQYESEEILAKSPRFLRKFDEYLLNQAPYYLQIAYGTENQEEIPLGEPGDFYNKPKGVMGFVTGDRTRAYYPGQPELEDTTYLHETGHAKFPYGVGTLDRAYTSFIGLANKLGIGVTSEDQPDDENAVTTLDLYRGLSNSDEKEIKQAVGYLMLQHEEIPGTPTLRNDESLDILKERALRYVFDIADSAGNEIMSKEDRQRLADDMESVFDANRDVIKKYVQEYGTKRLKKAPGGFVSAQGQGTTGKSDTGSYKQANLSTTYEGDGFIVKPRVNYDERTNTQDYPDGVVVNEKGKNIGFAMDGQMFLSDDKSIRAGFERQATNVEGRVDLPEQYGGETIEFGGGSKMKRYNMGATFGPLDIDISKTQLPGGDSVMGGSARYRFSEDGDVTLEAMDDGRSGRIALNYRF